MTIQDYSQFGEQAVIFDQLFRIGLEPQDVHVTDIGANDGITLSNSYALIQLGASADLFEPSPAALERLRETHAGNGRVVIHPFGIGPRTETATFYESAAHATEIYGDNVALLSTAVRGELARWQGREKFQEIRVPLFRWIGLGITPGDVVSIDAEGMDWQILQQMDLSEVSVLVIEYNGQKAMKTLVDGYCRGAYGMHKVFENGTNLIYSR